MTVKRGRHKIIHHLRSTVEEQCSKSSFGRYVKYDDQRLRARFVVEIAGNKAGYRQGVRELALGSASMAPNAGCRARISPHQVSTLSG